MADEKDDADLDSDFNMELNQEFGEQSAETSFEKKELPKGPMIVGGLVAAGAIWMLIGLFKGGPAAESTEITEPAMAGSSDKVKSQIVNPMLEGLEQPSELSAKGSETTQDTALSIDAALPQGAATKEAGHEQAAAAPAAPATPPAPVHDEEVQKGLERIEGQTQMLAQKLMNLETMLRASNADNSAVQEKLESVTKAVEDMGGTITEVQKNVDLLVHPPKPVNEDLALKEAFTNPQWHVHAVIPGRAWLKNTDGQTITVIEGDKLDVYGTVLAIDSDNSAVTTSSGITFR